MRIYNLLEERALDSKQLLLKTQQELLDLGFDDVDIVKVDDKRLDSVRESYPSVLDHGLDADGHLLCIMMLNKMYLVNANTCALYNSSEKAFEKLYASKRLAS